MTHHPPRVFACTNARAGNRGGLFLSFADFCDILKNMFSLFGGRDKKGIGGTKTVLVLDVENGSVGGALVRLDTTNQPRLFAELRTELPVFPTLSSTAIAQAVVEAAQTTLQHAAEVAARLRQNESLAPVGVVSQAVVFLAPPWSSASVGEQGFAWDHEPHLTRELTDAIVRQFGPVPVSFRAIGGAAAHATTSVFEQQSDFILCTVTGEVAELVLIADGLPTGRATVPTGLHTLLRTLRHHGGLSLPEARSAVRLAVNHDGRAIPELSEPFDAAARHIATNIAQSAAPLIRDSDAAGVLVLAHEPVGQWVARALSESEPFAALFKNGSTVRALRPQHLSPHIALHAQNPDVFLMVEAIFLDTKFTTL